MCVPITSFFAFQSGLSEAHAASLESEREKFENLGREISDLREAARSAEAK